MTEFISVKFFEYLENLGDVKLKFYIFPEWFNVFFYKFKDIDNSLIIISNNETAEKILLNSADLDAEIKYLLN